MESSESQPEDSLPEPSQASGSSVRVWVVRGGRHRESEAESLADNLVAIGFWQLPDLSLVESKDDVGSLFHEYRPDDKTMQVAARKVFVYQFVREIQVGDLVLLPMRKQ